MGARGVGWGHGGKGQKKGGEEAKDRSAKPGAGSEERAGQEGGAGRGDRRPEGGGRAGAGSRLVGAGPCEVAGGSDKRVAGAGRGGKRPREGGESCELGPARKKGGAKRARG